MTEYTNRLTPVQEQVIVAIAAGATIQAAAEAAGIHRNTIAYWRRTSINFREALGHAHYDRAICIREEAESHLADAFAAVHAILTKPDASDAARLNAAKFIIEKASTPPPPDPETAYHIEAVSMVAPGHQETSQEPPAAQPEIVHSNAQSTQPNVGRNTPCPCGSGLKFKRCCLGKPQPTPKTAHAA